jgi:signal transduction histidine kinase
MARIGAWEFDPATLNGTWTDEVANIHELDPEIEPNVEMGLRFYQGESRHIVESAVREAIDQGKPYDLELEIVTAKGNHKWVRTIGMPVKQKDRTVKIRGAFQDITQRKQVEEKLRALTGQLISAQESESRRLARELHDSFGQRLAVLNMKLFEAEAVVSSHPDLALERLREMGTELGSVAKDIHQLSRQLHPAVLVQLGLETAIENECAAHSQRHDCAVEFSAENIPEHLADEVALCFFRVAQECLQNVSKHAQARAASVTLRGRDHEIVMVIQDRGKGFDVSAIRKGGGLGLTSMEERIRLVNGILSVSSKPGEGTQVEVRIPLGGS